MLDWRDMAWWNCSREVPFEVGDGESMVRLVCIIMCFSTATFSLEGTGIRGVGFSQS